MENKPLFQILDFYGYRQHIEGFEVSGKTIYRWIFYITGFSYCDKFAHILKSDGSTEFVPIDKKDRILINGKLYGRDHWNH